MSICRLSILPFALPLILAAQPAQQCQVELFIGDPEFSTGDAGPALNAKFAGLGSVAATNDGTIYVSDYYAYRIRKIDPQGVITTIAGTGVRGTAGDGGPAIQAQVSSPGELSFSPDGSLYFVDGNRQVIRRITANGTMETVYSVPRGSINGIFTAAGGVVYFTETAPPANPAWDTVIGLYRLENDGSKTTIAGGLPPALFGPPIDAVPALEFRFSFAGPVTIDSDGRVLVVDRRRVMRIGDDGIIRAIVGNGSSSFVDGAPALESGLRYVPGLLLPTNDGDLLLGGSISGLYVVRNGLIHRLLSGQVESLTSSAAGVFLTKDDRVYRLLDDDALEAVAGVDRTAWYETGRSLSQTLIDAPRKMLTDSEGRLYYFDADFATVVTRTTLDGKIEVIAGGGDQPADDGVPALDASLGLVGDIALDGEDRLYISVGPGSGRPSMILRVEFDGALTVLAGDGDMAQTDRFYNQEVVDANFAARVPLIAVTPDGVLYFHVNGRSFLVDTDGIMRAAPPGQASFMVFDRDGRLLAVNGDFEVYTDLTAPPFEPFGLFVTQGASASNGTFFALAAGQRILRRTPDGRTTDLFSQGAGFEFAQGKLAPNSGLGAPFAIAANKEGDLFITDPSLRRMFVVRDADTCTMERPYSADVLNGASFTTNLGTKGFAPGELVSVFGDFLGGDALAYGAPGQSSQGTWQTSVGGLEVFVDDQPAPIIFSRADQAAFVIPNEVSGEMRLRFRRNGLDSPTFSYAVKNASPGVFTVNSSGGGQAAALNQDASINSPSDRAAPGSVIVLYVTGAGLTTPPSQTGSLNEYPLGQLVEAVELEINGVPAVVEFAGPAPGLISGVVQINARIPAETPAGTDAQVVVKIGGVEARESPSGQWPTISIH
jgi:uncharacterized protein (TIGR03437 family)